MLSFLNRTREENVEEKKTVYSLFLSEQKSNISPANEICLFHVSNAKRFQFPIHTLFSRAVYYAQKLWMITTCIRLQWNKTISRITLAEHNLNHTHNVNNTLGFLMIPPQNAINIYVAVLLSLCIIFLRNSTFLSSLFFSFSFFSVVFNWCFNIITNKLITHFRSILHQFFFHANPSTKHFDFFVFFSADFRI